MKDFQLQKNIIARTNSSVDKHNKGVSAQNEKSNKSRVLPRPNSPESLPFFRLHLYFRLFLFLFLSIFIFILFFITSFFFLLVENTHHSPTCLASPPPLPSWMLPTLTSSVSGWQRMCEVRNPHIYFLEEVHCLT